jgi:hypothetical protein
LAPNGNRLLHVKRIAVAPNKTDTILIVDPNAVLALPIAFQGLQVVPRKNGQVTQKSCSVQLQELSLRSPCDLVKPPGALAFE